MDKYDLAIIDELQKNGKISIVELGKQIGLSTSATSERIKKLEQEDIIQGYRAIINADKIGIDITAFVTIQTGNMSIHEMSKMLASIPQIQECHKVTGDASFMVKVKTGSTKELVKLLDQISDVTLSTYTYMVLSTIKETTCIDLQNVSTE
ncbi:MAG: Lrp/AsnC family transcriptional regulator [Bacillota bacterium]